MRRPGENGGMRVPSPTPDPPHAGGQEELVQLDPDHPGFRAEHYRERRNAIARLALEYREGDPPPRIDYTEADHAVWRTVLDHLARPHGSRAIAH